MNIKLIPVLEENLHVIQNLASNVWPQTYSQLLSKAQIEYMMKMMYSTNVLRNDFQRGILFYTIEFKDQNVGFISIELNHNKSQDLYIHKLYILADYHFSGLGKQTIMAIQRIALAHDLSGISLNVNRKNKAKDFYLKMGFFIEKEEDLHIGNDFLMQDFVMKKVF